MFKLLLIFLEFFITLAIFTNNNNLYLKYKSEKLTSENHLEESNFSK